MSALGMGLKGNWQSSGRSYETGISYDLLAYRNEGERDSDAARVEQAGMQALRFTGCHIIEWKPGGASSYGSTWFLRAEYTETETERDERLTEGSEG